MAERICTKCGQSKPASKFEQRRNVCNHCRYLKKRKPKGGSFIETGNLAIAESRRNPRIKTLDQLLTACSVNLQEWKVDTHTVNSWEQASKDESGKPQITTLFQVKANLSRIKALPTEFPEIRAVSIHLPPTRKSPTFTRIDGLRTALIIPDSQNGYRRHPLTGKLDPFHDRAAWDCAIQIAATLQPDEIILLGDMLDLPEWSDKFLTSPEMRFTTQATIDELGYILGLLRKASPQSRIRYLAGNHGERLTKAILTNMIAAYGLRQANMPDSHPVLSIPHLLGLDMLGIEFVGPYPAGEIWLSPELRVIHGDLVRQRGGETARAILRDTDCSTIYGHIHRFELVAKTSHRNGKIITRYASSPGCIARIDGATPAHSPRNDWQQGLEVVTFSEDCANLGIELLPINDGLCMFRGTPITGRFDLEALRKATKNEFY